MAQHMEQYDAIVAEAQKALDAAREKWEAAEKAHSEARAAYRATEGEFTRAFDRAWLTFRESPDPLVKWIGDNCEGYSAHALEILRALPATMDQLERIAEDGDWCRDWDRFVERAREAGVLPEDGPGITEEQQQLKQWVRASYGNNSGFNRRLRAAVDAEVAAALARAEAERAATTEELIELLEPVGE